MVGEGGAPTEVRCGTWLDSGGGGGGGGGGGAAATEACLEVWYLMRAALRGLEGRAVGWILSNGAPAFVALFHSVGLRGAMISAVSAPI